MKKLKRDFFDRSTLLVAQELLGKVLVFKDMRGVITETEAYCGFDDPASHAARGKTERTKLMFGKPGISYVYLIYGMYHCLNIVTECEEYPAAVLIRAIQIFKEGQKNAYKKTRNNNERYFVETEPKLDGPGKLCRFLGITRAENGIDMISSPELYIADANIKLDFLSTPRIGISAGQDKNWRYVAKVTLDK